MSEIFNPANEHKELIRAGREIILAAPQLYIDVDIESDGWAGHGSMLSLGAIAPGGEKFYSEIKPLFEDFVPSQRQFCEEHGLQRKRLFAVAPDYLEVVKAFSEWVSMLQEQTGKKPVFAAFNAGFDFGFVQQYYLKAGIANPFGAAPFDLKSLALAVNPGWDWSKTIKGNLPETVLPEGDFTHNALEDAEYQQQIHFALAGLLAQKYGS